MITETEMKLDPWGSDPARCGFPITVTEPEIRPLKCGLPKEHKGWHIFTWTVPVEIEIQAKPANEFGPARANHAMKTVFKIQVGDK